MSTRSAYAGWLNSSGVTMATTVFATGVAGRGVHQGEPELAVSGRAEPVPQAVQEGLGLAAGGARAGGFLRVLAIGCPAGRGHDAGFQQGHGSTSDLTTRIAYMIAYDLSREVWSRPAAARSSPPPKHLPSLLWIPQASGRPHHLPPRRGPPTASPSAHFPIACRGGRQIAPASARLLPPRATPRHAASHRRRVRDLAAPLQLSFHRSCNGLDCQF